MKTTLLALLSLTTLAGCSGTKEAYRFASYPLQPQTVTLTDVTTGQAIWSYEVPPGRELALKFARGKASAEAQGYDEMSWRVTDIGGRGGGTTNKLRVPPASMRRLDLDLRDIPEGRREAAAPARVEAPIRSGAKPAQKPAGVVLPDPNQPAPK